MIGFDVQNRLSAPEPSISFRGKPFGLPSITAATGLANPFDKLELETPDPSRDEEPRVVRRIPTLFSRNKPRPGPSEPTDSAVPKSCCPWVPSFVANKKSVPALSVVPYTIVCPSVFFLAGAHFRAMRHAINGVWPRFHTSRRTERRTVTSPATPTPPEN